MIPSLECLRLNWMQRCGVADARTAAGVGRFSSETAIVACMQYLPGSVIHLWRLQFGVMVCFSVCFTYFSFVNNDMRCLCLSKISFSIAEFPVVVLQHTLPA